MREVLRRLRVRGATASDAFSLGSVLEAVPNLVEIELIDAIVAGVADLVARKCELITASSRSGTWASGCPAED